MAREVADGADDRRGRVLSGRGTAPRGFELDRRGLSA